MGALSLTRAIAYLTVNFTLYEADLLYSAAHELYSDVTKAPYITVFASPVKMMSLVKDHVQVACEPFELQLNVPPSSECTAMPAPCGTACSSICPKLEIARSQFEPPIAAIKSK